ncbi:MAG: pilus assembly protein [Methylocystis sp.]|nr:pilus assembly protein [Methylocystis sp.]
MSFIRACRDQRGATAVEFALTLPAFFMLLFGIAEGGLLVWTQLGMQHGAEMAARCATVNTTLCGSTSAIQTYAAAQAYGVNLAASIFTVSAPACGNQVSASYPFQFLTSYWGTPTLTLSASACFPK